jgi:hypothetical protein
MLQDRCRLLLGLAVAVSTAYAQDNDPPADFETLFNGNDLTHWIADPQALAHWSVDEGVLRSDGQGSTLATDRHFRNVELRLDWRAPAGSSGGVYLRSRPRVAIADPAAGNEGSGGIGTNKEASNKPTSRADKPAGEWNTFRIQIVGDAVTVHLNDQLVTENVRMENAFDSSRRLPTNGRIELEAKGPIEFRNIFLRNLEAPANP